jgi:putative glycosyltransferase (TIGR04372 family)
MDSWYPWLAHPLCKHKIVPSFSCSSVGGGVVLRAEKVGNRPVVGNPQKGLPNRRRDDLWSRAANDLDCRLRLGLVAAFWDGTDCSMSPLKKLRKLLKSRMARHPVTRVFYEVPSLTLRAAKLLLALGINQFFPILITPRLRLAMRYMGEGKFNKALAIANDVLTREPGRHLDDNTLGWLAAICYMLGRAKDAYRVWTLAEGRRWKLARDLQYDRLGLRFFTKAHFFGLGHLGVLDKYVKAEMLGMIPQCKNIILGAAEEFPNPAYIRYLEKYFSCITDPRAVSLLAALPLQVDFSVVRAAQGELRTTTAFCGDVQFQWEQEGRPPLLELNPEDRTRGYQVLHELGVPEGTWFAGLHVREGTDRMRDVRNSDITTYRLAIEEIANRGGWVLRMGDHSMRPLPPWPNTIDYAHSERREDWMDVFLWAEGRFFIASASGPQQIPTTFGKPVAITNYGPLAHFYCAKDDILLPKHYWHEREARYLTLPERMSEGPGFLESIELLAALGIRVIDNSAEELRDLVIEIMDRLQARHSETEQERAAQAHFAEMAAARNLYPARIARAFLSRCPELFQPSRPTTPGLMAG